MKLKTNSWHYRLWADSFGLYETTPKTTDLCRYCHRVFWQIMWRAFLAFGLMFIVGALVYGVFYKGLYLNPRPTLAVMGLIAVVGGLTYLYQRWLHRSSETGPKTLVGQWLQARKEKVCPVVEFSEDE